jgi:UDP-glucose 4-epimerase
VRLLVTGALGFVGHAVVRQLLADGHEPIALSSRPDAQSQVTGVRTVHADIRDRSALSSVVDETAPEGACHLAALTNVRDSFTDPLGYYEVNVAGTLNLLRSLASRGVVPVVLASTGAVYGAGEGRITEDHPTKPTNPYGASKLAAEQLLTYHAETGAVGATILRCFNIAGAVEGVGDRDLTRIIPKALAVAAGEATHVHINGDGKAVREFTHVADVAQAIALALRSTHPGQPQTYNVGSGVPTTMLDVIEAVERVTDRPIAVEYGPPKPEPAVLMADSSRINRQLGWTPARITVEEIVRDGWAAIRDDL